MDPIAKLARRIRGVEKLAFKAATQPQLAYSSIEDGAIQSVEDGSLKAVIGKQFDGTQSVLIVNGPVPPTPSAPTGDPALEGAILRWDGTFEGDAIVPLDFARVELHVSTDPDFTAEFAETLKATFETPRGGEVFVSLIPATYYAKLVTRTSSGLRSTPSAAFSVVPQALADSIPAVGTDGDVPVIPGGWTPNLDSFAVGGLISSWLPVTNQDPVTYDVYVSAGAAPTVFDATTLVGSTSGTSKVIGKLPDGTRLNPDTDYYIAVSVRDADGAATTRPTAGPARPRRADNVDISADYGYLGSLEANQIQSGDLEADIAILGRLDLGDNIHMSPKDGIVISSPDGTTKLATDGTGNKFAGEATLSAVTVLDKLGIYGLTNFLSGLLSLNKGVTDPTSAPVVTSSYDIVDTGGDRLNPRGLTMNTSNDAWVVTDNLAGYTSNFQFWNASSGVGGGAITIANGYEAWGGIVRIGSWYYILACPIGTGGIGSQYRILKYSATTNTWSLTSAVVLTGAGSRPAIGTDGTNLLMAYLGSSGNQLNIRTLDPSFTSGAAPTVLASRVAAVGLWGTTDIVGVTGAVIDGSMRFIASSANGHFAYDLTSSTVITRNTAYEWPAAAPGSVTGVHWTGTNFQMVSKRRFYTYSNLSGQWKFAYSWYDNDLGGSGRAETKPTAPFVISPTKYAKWTVSLPQAPPDDGTTDGANTAIIYAAKNDGSALVQQTILAEGTLSATYSTLLSSGTAPQGANQFASRTGAIGNIASTASDSLGTLISLKGDGSGRVGPYRFDSSGELPAAELYKTGSQSGSSTSAIVNFDTARWLTGGMIKSATGMIQVPKSGWYQVHANVMWGSSTSSARRILGIAINSDGSASSFSAITGTAIAYTQPAASLTGQTMSGMVYLTAGQYVGAWFNSAVSFGLDVTSTYHNNLAVGYMGG